MIDSLVECTLCKSPYCYQHLNEGVANWRCLSCGYATNSNMMKNTELVNAFEKTLPRLYKEIKKIDESELVWFPLVIDKTQEGKGVLFANGTSVDDWMWTFAPATLVTSEEKERFKTKDGKYIKYKTDMLNAKNYKRTEFALALNELELL